MRSRLASVEFISTLGSGFVWALGFDPGEVVYEQEPG